MDNVEKLLGDPSRFYKSQKYVSPLERVQIPSLQPDYDSINNQQSDREFEEFLNNQRKTGTPFRQLKRNLKEEDRMKETTSDGEMSGEENNTIEPSRKRKLNQRSHSSHVLPNKSSSENATASTKISKKITGEKQVAVGSVSPLKNGSENRESEFFASIDESSTSVTISSRCSPRFPKNTTAHEASPSEVTPKKKRRTVLAENSSSESDLDKEPENEPDCCVRETEAEDSGIVHQVETKSSDQNLRENKVCSGNIKSGLESSGDESPTVSNSSNSAKSGGSMTNIRSPEVRKKQAVRPSPKFIATGNKSKKDTMVQLMLDAGQKHIEPEYCSVCQYMYTPNLDTDVEDHKKHHAFVLGHLNFPSQGWKSVPIVTEYLPRFKIYQINPSSPRYALKKLEEVLTIVNRDLGYPEQSENLAADEQVFLYVNQDPANPCVVGCLVAEPLRHAYVSAKFGECNPDQREKAMMGVNRIWVRQSFRRKKIGTRLLETARCFFYNGVAVRKNLLAFCDPTEDGRALASQFMGSENILVYKRF